MCIPFTKSFASCCLAEQINNSKSPLHFGDTVLFLVPNGLTPTKKYIANVTFTTLQYYCFLSSVMGRGSLAASGQWQPIRCYNARYMFTVNFLRPSRSYFPSRDRPPSCTHAGCKYDSNQVCALSAICTAP